MTMAKKRKKGSYNLFFSLTKFSPFLSHSYFLSSTIPLLIPINILEETLSQIWGQLNLRF